MISPNGRPVVGAWEGTEKELKLIEGGTPYKTEVLVLSSKTLLKRVAEKQKLIVDGVNVAKRHQRATRATTQCSAASVCLGTQREGARLQDSSARYWPHQTGCKGRAGASRGALSPAAVSTSRATWS